MNMKNFAVKLADTVYFSLSKNSSLGRVTFEIFLFVFFSAS